MLRKTAGKIGTGTYLIYFLPTGGFSPFELLFGSDERGLLDVMSESWQAQEKSKESVVSYVLSAREKLQEMAELVKNSMEKAKDNQKRWYDKDARLRVFKPGDEVLVLLPTSQEKLLAQWHGPYQIVKRNGRVTYLVDMHNKKKRKRIFHVNMLKKFCRPDPNHSNYLSEEESMEEALMTNIPVWNETPSDQVVVGNLHDAQQHDLHTLLQDFDALFQNMPGRTEAATHYIKTGDATPIRLAPYRFNHTYQDVVARELQEMESQDNIERSSAAAIILVPKDKTIRICVDYVSTPQHGLTTGRLPNTSH